MIGVLLIDLYPLIWGGWPIATNWYVYLRVNELVGEAMTPSEAERALDELKTIREVCEMDKNLALAAYCIEMTQLEKLLVE